MGKHLNLDIAKDQQKILSETFVVSQDELEAEIRVLRSDDSAPKGSDVNKRMAQLVKLIWQIQDL
jgi:hypothetical protein